jgi:hypothetical protein
MNRRLCKGILCATTVAACAVAQAQSNIYSVGIFSAGTTYFNLCSLAFPSPPYQFTLQERSWYQTADGLHIINFGREREDGGIFQRVLEVGCGSESFTVRLDPCPPGAEAWCGAAEHPIRAVVIAGGDLPNGPKLVVLLDGSAGFYSTNGGRMIREGQNPELNSAARKLVVDATQIWSACTITTNFSVPEKEHTRFYLITHNEILTCEAAEELLAAGRHRASSLYVAAQSLAAKIRLAQGSATAESGVPVPSPSPKDSDAGIHPQPGK